MTDLENAALNLLAAAARLRPSDAAMRGLPDAQLVNLQTTAGALRQFARALSEARGPILAMLSASVDVETVAEAQKEGTP